jgi:SlyX protein|tara:strand:- start:294 stop:533 length:240 start_codon:yes stop_codon:yes gene_type:complete
VGVIRLAEININKEVRINELEARLAHQDHSIEKMSDEIYRQQKQIFQLEDKVKWLVERLELVAPPQSSNNQPDEAPPHY